jgi:predicted sugar kinase
MSELIKHYRERYQTEKLLFYREVEVRMQMAMDRWWAMNGEVPACIIADDLRVNLSNLTERIQYEIGKKAGMKILNTEQPCIIESTIKELENNTHRMARISYSPEFYLYLANNSREQIISDYHATRV